MKARKQLRMNRKEDAPFPAIVFHVFQTFRERFLKTVRAWTSYTRSLFVKPTRMPRAQANVTQQEQTPLPNVVSSESSPVDVNLLPFEGDRAEEKTIQTVSLRLLLVALLTFVGVGLLWGGVRWFFWIRHQRLAALEQEEATIDQSLKTFEQRASQIEELERRIASVRVLLNRHVLWTQFFSLLEKYTLPDVYYTTLSVGLGEKISMTGIARDFEALARQLLVLEKASDFVRGVSISSAQAVVDTHESKEAGNVQFTIELDLNPDIFYFTP